MKTTIFLFALLLSTSVVFAQTKKAEVSQQQKVVEQPIKSEVATPDLPDPIKNVITTKYNEWKLMSAHVYNAVPDYYELELKKGEENIVVKIDAKGKEL